MRKTVRLRLREKARLSENAREAEHTERWDVNMQRQTTTGVHHFGLPRYPSDAPAGARVLRHSKHIVELAGPKGYLGLFALE